MKNRTIPFYPLSKVPRARRERWKEEIAKVIDSGVFIGGSSVVEFEHSWARQTGTPFAIGVSNGFDGLTLALESIKLEPGSLVAVPSHTFIATWTSVIRSGLVPIGVDVDDEGLLDLDEFELVSSQVRAVIPVHMHGSMVNMHRLKEICKKSDIYIVEDASQAHFALQRGKSAGSYGDLGVFSLYPTKNLGALGDAGIITTSNKILYDNIMELRSYGSSKDDKYEHRRMGYNQRLDSIQAAILMVNLEYLESDNRRRYEIAAHYQNELKYDFFSPLQQVSEGRVFHHYCLISKYRDDLREYLLNKGVNTEIHYPNLAAIEVGAIQGRRSKVNFPNGERISKSSISLPISPWHSDNEIEYVIHTLKGYIPNSIRM